MTEAKINANMTRPEFEAALDYVSPSLADWARTLSDHSVDELHAKLRLAVRFVDADLAARRAA